MLERFTSTILLKPAAAEYAERARYYRQRAVIASVSRGIRDHVNGDVQGADIVDVAEVPQAPLSTDNLGFAFDSKGIAFARIEKGKYYPISNKDSYRDLESARENEKRSKSFLRRFFNRRLQSVDRALFNLAVQADSASYSVLKTSFIIHSSSQYVKKQRSKV